MASDQFAIDRRSFIKAAAPFALAIPAVIRGQVLIERGRFSPDDVPLARQQLLEIVNAERRQHGLTHLELDDLACRVAADHALDILIPSRHYCRVCPAITFMSTEVKES